MSKYTTEVRFICETESGTTDPIGFNTINDILTAAAPIIFNFDFPIFDENYRLPLEIKILRHYYTREICEETVGLWKLRLQDKLNIIMPYYNKLYESELIQYNPLYDVDLTREHSMVNQGENSSEVTGNTVKSEDTATEKYNDTSGESSKNSSTNSVNDVSNTSLNEISSNTSHQNENASTSSSNTTDNETTSATKNDSRTDKYSDTPQGSINNIDLVNNAYLTNARIINEDETAGSSRTGTTGTTTSDSMSESGANTTSTSETNNYNGSENNASESSNVEINYSESKDEENTVKNSTTNVNKSNIGSVTNTEEYIEHVFGKQGSASKSKLLKEFRETFLNIDKMVIDELSTLFFGLW